MKRSISKIILTLFLTGILICNVWGQQLHGKIGSSRQYYSGWLDLQSITKFQIGDELIIRVGGTAQQVLIRLLPKDGDPSSPIEIVGNARRVPPDHVIRVILESNYSQIKQISVHGGPSPWGQYDLGATNGYATIVNVILRRHN